MTRRVTIEELERWRDGGAVWRPVEVTDEHAVVELCACTGERMELVDSDEPELIAYVRARRDD